MSFVLQQPIGSASDLVFDPTALTDVLKEFPTHEPPFVLPYFSVDSGQTIICTENEHDVYRQQICSPMFDSTFHLGAGDPWLKPICEGTTCQPPACTDCGPHPTPEPQFVLMLLAFFVALVALKCIWRKS